MYPEPSPVSILFFTCISGGGDGKDIEDITWPRGDKKFITREIFFISSHVRISYRLYRFVTTRYTTDFDIINCIIFYYSFD